MERNNHNNQNATKHQGTHHDGVKETDDQTKESETTQPVQKPTTPHTK